MTTAREDAMRIFIEAGLASFTGLDVPQVGDKLPRGQGIYTMLCTIAPKLSVQELQGMSNAFDGVDASGNTLCAKN